MPAQLCSASGHGRALLAQEDPAVLSVGFRVGFVQIAERWSTFSGVDAVAASREIGPSCVAFFLRDRAAVRAARMATFLPPLLPVGRIVISVHGRID